MGVQELGVDEEAVRAADAKQGQGRARTIVALTAITATTLGFFAGGAQFRNWQEERDALNAAREFTKNPDALERLRQCQQPADALGELVVLELVDPGSEYGWTDTALAALVATEGNASKLAESMAAQSSVSQTGDQGYAGWQVGEVGVFAAQDVDAGSTTGDNPIFRVPEIQGIVCQAEEFMPRSVDTPE